MTTLPPTTAVYCCLLFSSPCCWSCYGDDDDAADAAAAADVADAVYAYAAYATAYAAAAAAAAAAARSTNDPNFLILKDEIQYIQSLPKDQIIDTLLNQPLWAEYYDDVMDEIRETTLNNWRDLKSRLITEDKKSWALIQWYERLLNHGPSGNEDYEIARLKAFEKHYDQRNQVFDLASINAALIEIEDKYFPREDDQIPSIHKFGEQHGKIIARPKRVRRTWLKMQFMLCKANAKNSRLNAKRLLLMRAYRIL